MDARDRKAHAVISDLTLVLGWEEWAAFPGLALPAIKAKIDTGAKTSALHAEGIEPYGPASARRVRFVVRPAPHRLDLVIACSAPLIDQRAITSSNGMTEDRYVIGAEIVIAGHAWPIEISLSDRRDMSYRMLLGRQALQAGCVLIDPSTSFRQTRLSYKLYPGYLRPKSGRG